MAGSDAEACTRFFGIAGNPATHSKSPPLFNRLFERYGLDAYYTRFQHPDIGEIIRQANAMDAKGLSVTIPFKEQVMAHLDEIDPVAREIGAVNTVVSCGGISIGYNTDWLGIRKPLEDSAGKRAVILGAGGAAAGAAYAARSLGMETTFLVRNPEKALPLAGRFGFPVGHLKEFADMNPAVVINATSVGMQPDTNTPVPVSQLKRTMTVFDLVYTPEETPLLQGARKAGCRVIYGTSMFAHQAQAQFRLFTGIDSPLDIVRSLIP